MIISQVSKRYREIRFSWKLATKTAVFGAMVFFLALTIPYDTSSNYFPIKEVKIAGIQHIDQEEIQRQLLPLVNKSFFVVDVERIKERLMQFPWVAEVSVRRVWPQQIVIQVHEKKSLARWNNTSLLSTNGEIFRPPLASFPERLPQFIGAEGEQMLMLHYYKKIDGLLGALHFKIARFEWAPTQTLALTLTNGIKISLGNKDILTHIGHFVKVYPKIVGDRTTEVDYIDLRYTNGLAVRWKT